MSSPCAKRRVCPSGAGRRSAAERSVLLMRAECSANRVALVRTRSINEIKTDLREQRSFRSIASLAVGRPVDRPVQRDGSTVGFIRADPPAAIGRLCHTIILSFMFSTPYVCTCLSVYFVRNERARTGSSLMRVITATSDSRGISLI